jgi:hypothetical protein
MTFHHVGAAPRTQHQGTAPAKQGTHLEFHCPHPISITTANPPPEYPANTRTERPKGAPLPSRVPPASRQVRQEPRRDFTVRVLRVAPGHLALVVLYPTVSRTTNCSGCGTAPHEGPRCRGCGAMYRSLTELPEHSASDEAGKILVKTPYCPKCGWELFCVQRVEMPGQVPEQKKRYCCWDCNGSGKDEGKPYWAKGYHNVPEYEPKATGWRKFLGLNPRCEPCKGTGYIWRTEAEILKDKNGITASREILQENDKRVQREIAVARALRSGHRGPICRNCGAAYGSNSQLPRQTASHDSQITTTCCPKCGSENIF